MLFTAQLKVLTTIWFFYTLEYVQGKIRFVNEFRVIQNFLCAATVFFSRLKKVPFLFRVFENAVQLLIRIG
jgi:hypothetical protein